MCIVNIGGAGIIIRNSRHRNRRRFDSRIDGRNEQTENRFELIHLLHINILRRSFGVPKAEGRGR